MSSATVFLPDAYTGHAWAAAQAQHGPPRASTGSWEEIREELAVRDLLARYVYGWDQGDVDGLMQLFTEDCVMTNPHGRFLGLPEVRANYERTLQGSPRRFHIFSNVVVRLAETLHEGSVTAYHFAVQEPDGDAPRYLGGLLADHVVKRSGQWKISDHMVTVDIIASLAGVSEGP